LIPKTYEGQVSFTILSPGERGKGCIFTFPSRETLDSVREYDEEFGSMFSTYVYIEGNVLVQIASDMLQDQAEWYGEVLRET
jgi:hypothetical protein